MSENILIDPITNRHASPIVRIQRKLIGTDVIGIRPQSFHDADDTPSIWELVACDIDVVTDATVANRRTYTAVTTKDGQLTQDGVLSNAITASQTVYVRYGSYSNFSNMAPGTGTVMWTAINRRFQMLAYPEYLYYYLQAGVAGDTVQFEISLRCLNRELGILPKGY